MGREQRWDDGQGAAVVHSPARQADDKAAAQAPPVKWGQPRESYQPRFQEKLPLALC